MNLPITASTQLKQTSSTKRDSWIVLLGIILPVMVAIFVMRGVLFTEGIIMHGDTAFPLDMHNWVTSHLYSWNQWNDQPSVHLPKFPIIATFAILPLWLGLPSALVAKVVITSILALGGIMTYFAMYVHPWPKKKKLNFTWLLCICIFPALIFQLNPWVALHIVHHAWFIISLSSMVLLLSIIIRLLDYSAMGLVTTIKFGLAISLLVGLISTTPQFIFYSLFLILVVFGFHYRESLRLRSPIVMIMMITIGLNLYWLMPYVALIGGSPGTITGESVVETSESKIQLHSRNSQALNVINLDSNWDLDISHQLHDPFLDSVWITSGIIVFFFGLVYLMRRGWNSTAKQYFIFLFLFICAIMLAQGTVGPLGNQYMLLVELPLGWIFRDPNKFVGLIIVALTFTSAFSIHWIAQRCHRSIRVQSLMAGILMFAILFHSWPMLTGTFNNRFVSLNPPSDYYETLDYLKGIDQESVLWYPSWSGTYSWDPTGYWSGKDIARLSSYNPVFASNSQTRTFWQYFFGEMLKSGNTSDLDQILSAIGVKYVVVHDDYVDSSEIKQIEAALRSSPDLTVAKETPNFVVFKTNSDATMFSAKTLNLLNKDDNIKAISYVANNYGLEDTTLVTASTMQNVPTVSAIESVRMTAGWQFDNEDDFIEWTNATSSSSQTLSSRSGMLVAELHPNTKGWRSVTSPPVSIENALCMEYSLNLKAENSEGVHVTLNELDKELKVIKRFKITDLGSGTFSISDRTIVTCPDIQEAKFLSLELRHRNRDSGNVSSTLSVDSVETSIESFSEEKYSLDANHHGIPALSYAKIDPTHYIVQINATSPFMLTFAEAFDPLWEARVYVNGNNEKIAAVPVYSTINGFWITQTGMLEIEVFYGLQHWAELGMIISFFVLSALVILWILMKFPHNATHRIRGSRPNTIH